MPRSPKKPGRRGYAAIFTSALTVSLAAAIALLCNIRLKEELNRLETDIGRLDHQLALRKRINRKSRMDYETLVSSSGLNLRVQEMGLDLVMPDENARIVLPEPPIEAVASDASLPHTVDRRLAFGTAADPGPAGPP